MSIHDILLAILIAAAALFVFLCLHVAVWRLPYVRTKGFLLMLVLFLLAFGITFLLFGVLSDRELLGFCCVSGSVYLLLMMLYMHFYAGILRSVCVRILGELVNSRAGRLTLDELDNLYPKSTMVQERVAALVRNGWLVEDGGRFRCKSKGICMARIGIFLSKMYREEVSKQRIMP